VATETGPWPLNDEPGSGRVEIDLRALRVIGTGTLGMAVVLSFLSLPDVVLCPLRRWTGIPCAFCGMTRSVVALVHGDVGSSLALNPGGVLLVAAAVALLVTWSTQRVEVPTWWVGAFFATLWAYQLAKYLEGRPL